MDLCKLGLLLCLLAQKVIFQSFFKSFNGLGNSNGLWDTIPSIRSCVQKASLYVLFCAFVHVDFSYSLCYSLIRQNFL